MLKDLKLFFTNKAIRNKLMITLGIIALYRFLVYVPVPFADVDVLNLSTWVWSSALSYFALLLWWTLDSFSILAVWVAPYINASILIQLLTGIIPKLEQLQDEWEVWQKKIAQITRWITFPLAILQWFWVSYFVNYYLWGNAIDLTWNVIILVALVMAFGTMLLLYLWDLITEKGIGNGISMIIFASILSWLSGSVFSSVWATTNKLPVIIFIVCFIAVLTILSIYLIKTLKEIPVIYARQWKVQQTSTLPFPLNPVGMVPIIFAVAFVSFPYLLSQLLSRFGGSTAYIKNASVRIEQNLNIYVNQPTALTIIVYFLVIVFFTFFYALVTFNPERIADNIQKKWWFIPSVRPGKETAKYISTTLSHLCLRGGIWLWLLGIFSYILRYIPFLENLFQWFGSIPVVVTGSGIIIIVWVVQDLINKIRSDKYMDTY